MRKILGIVALLAMLSSTALAQSDIPCVHNRSNLQNSGNSITVDATAGGITIAGPATGVSAGRCSVTVINTGAAAARCTATADGAPTATNGFLYAAGQIENFTFELNATTYKCFRTTGSSTTFDVIEGLP